MSVRKYILGTGFRKHHKYFQVDSSDKMKLVHSPCGMTVVTGVVDGVRTHLEDNCILFYTLLLLLI